MRMQITSIAEAFQDLLRALEPLESEVNALRSHRKTIEQALRGEFAGFNRVEPMGSHTHRTAIRRHSDVDYLAVLGKADVTRGGSRVSSTTTLGRLRRALDSRFSHTAVTTDGPAVVVHFGGGKGAVDVVPGTWERTVSGADGYPVFMIPDGSGGWLETGPQRHGRYLADADNSASFKLSRTIQLLKHWKYSRHVKIPFLAFHVSLLLASDGTCVGAKSYSRCLYDAFVVIRDRGGRVLNDPLVISRRIPLAYTQTQRDSVVNAARHAADCAARAIRAERSGNVAEALRQWKLVFNGQFG